MILHYSSSIIITWYSSNIRQTRYFFWMNFCKYIWNSFNIISFRIIRIREMMKTMSQLQISMCTLTNQHCVCRSSCRTMKKIIITIIWLHEKRAEIMIRRLFLLFKINIVRTSYQLSSTIIIIILWSLLIYLTFISKIICRSIWIWFFNIFCFIMIIKLN